MAQIVAHLGEVDARRVHAKRGFPSLFSYCVESLGFSEDEACRRIEAARLARRFPPIGDLLASGAVTLSVLGLLKPHLTEQNHHELLGGVSRRSVRQAKEWLAVRFPQPDVPQSIRKCPEVKRAAPLLPPDRQGLSSATPNPSLTLPEPGVLHTSQFESPATSRVSLDDLAASRPLLPTAPSPTSSPVRETPSASGRPAPVSSSRIDPLSSDRFLVKLTVTRAVKEKLELTRDLMRHRNPEGDLEVVLERALDALIAELGKTKLGQTDQPKKTRVSPHLRNSS
jgi:hypothetical protein